VFVHHGYNLFDILHLNSEDKCFVDCFFVSQLIVYINITTAVTIAENYLIQSGETNMTVSQVQEYTNTFYVQVTEKGTGTGAFELLINKSTGVVSPETGPNLSWDFKYTAKETYLGTISPMTVTASPGNC
jgi:hypothetical protein